MTAMIRRKILLSEPGSLEAFKLCDPAPGVGLRESMAVLGTVLSDLPPLGTEELACWSPLRGASGDEVWIRRQSAAKSYDQCYHDGTENNPGFSPATVI